MGHHTRQLAHRRILASASRRRTILRTKAEIAAAVCDGELSVEEACRRYRLRLEDFLTYVDPFLTNGPDAMREFESLEGQRIAQTSGDQHRRQRSAAHSGSAMSHEEALEILGLRKGAVEDQIRSAHRRLMMQNHPDRGGSDHIAARINGAKDVLLGH